jgi:hypothetical protein
MVASPTFLAVLSGDGVAVTVTVPTGGDRAEGTQITEDDQPIAFGVVRISENCP